MNFPILLRSCQKVIFIRKMQTRKKSRSIVEPKFLSNFGISSANNFENRSFGHRSQKIACSIKGKNLYIFFISMQIQFSYSIFLLNLNIYGQIHQLQSSTVLLVKCQIKFIFQRNVKDEIRKILKIQFYDYYEILNIHH